MKKNIILAITCLILLASVIPVFANSHTLGFDDDTVYVRLVKYRYDRSFPEYITHTENRGPRKFRGKLYLDYSSIRLENNNRYSAIYKGTCYDVGAAYAFK